MFGKNKKGNVSDGAYGVMLGEKLSFAAAEAYKLLRANLMFALPDGEEDCRVVGGSILLAILLGNPLFEKVFHFLEGGRLFGKLLK